MNFLKALLQAILNLFRKKPAPTPASLAPVSTATYQPQAPVSTPPVSLPATPSPKDPEAREQAGLKYVYKDKQELLDDIKRLDYKFNVYLAGERLNVGAGPDDVFVYQGMRVVRFGTIVEAASDPK